jgi:arylsulfatase A-like enzyme
MNRNRWAQRWWSAIASATGGLLLACGSAVDSAPPNIILIVIDTMRADHLSTYGYPRLTTPNLTKFADDSIRFDRAYATASWTVPSHASLFTGLYSIGHGATQEGERLDDDLQTAAELLAAAGYRTAAFSNNPWVSALSNMTQGFEHVAAMWKDKPALSESGFPHPTNQAVFRWLTEVDEPFFLFVNYMESHWPYEAPRRYQDRFVARNLPETLRKRSGFPALRWYLASSRFSDELVALRTALYDAELSYVDAVVGELLAWLKTEGLADDSMIVVTSDHGENFGDKGHQGHAFSLYDTTVRVPLFIHFPGGNGRGSVRKDPVQLVDVFATLLAAAGAWSTDPRVAGHDLANGPIRDRAVLAESYLPLRYLRRFPNGGEGAIEDRFKHRIRSIQVEKEKLIQRSDGRIELYDTSSDPAELDDLSAERPDRVTALTSTLDEMLDRFGNGDETRASTPALAEDARESLRALGYID